MLELDYWAWPRTSIIFWPFLVPGQKKKEKGTELDVPSVYKTRVLTRVLNQSQVSSCEGLYIHRSYVQFSGTHFLFNLVPILIPKPHYSLTVTEFQFLYLIFFRNNFVAEKALSFQ